MDTSRFVFLHETGASTNMVRPLELPCHLVRSRSNPRLADALVKRDDLRQSPLMLKN